MIGENKPHTKKLQYDTAVKQMKKYFTDGRAKNDIANTEKQDATILPIHVRGTVSPYPIVVTVICTQYETIDTYSRTCD